MNTKVTQPALGSDSINTHSALYVADELITLSKVEGSVKDLTPLVLENLLFYTHGLYAAIVDNQLIDENFEAWDVGPVIPVVHKKFSTHSLMDIRSYYDKEVFPSEEEEVTREIMCRVLDIYGVMSPQELVSKSKDTPLWAKSVRTKNRLMPYGEIRDHFRNLKETNSL
jgi:uncharacterized phage-associated protein